MDRHSQSMAHRQKEEENFQGVGFYVSFLSWCFHFWNLTASGTSEPTFSHHFYLRQEVW